MRWASQSTSGRPRTAAPPTAREALAGALFILVAAFAVYWPSLSGTFLFDDHFLHEQEVILDREQGLYRIWFTSDSADYWPLVYTLKWLQWGWWGHDTFGYHVIAVFLHVVVAWSLWWVLVELEAPVPWLIALLFTLHPVSVESAAWIIQQKTTLCTALYFLSLGSYLRFDSGPRWGWYAVSLLLFLLTMFAKTQGAMLPVVLVFVGWYRRGRIQISEIVRLLPFFAIATALVLIEIVFFQERSAVVVREDGFFSRLASAGWVWWFYARTVLFPVGLSIVYPRWRIEPTVWYHWLPTLAFFVLAGALLWRKFPLRRCLLAGLGFYFLNLFLVLGFRNISYMRIAFVADHWQYTALPGLLAVAVAVTIALFDRFRVPVGIRKGIAAAVIVLFVAQSCRLAATYRSSETLWAHALAVAPNSFVPWAEIGRIELENSRWEIAEKYLRRALQMQPDDTDTLFNLGSVLYSTHRHTEALRHLDEALRIRPSYGLAHFLRGEILLQMGQFPAARDALQQARHWRVKVPSLYANLALAQLAVGDDDSAENVLFAGLFAHPDSVVIQQGLVELYRYRNDPRRALLHAQRWSELEPENLDAKLLVGSLLLETDQVDAARSHFDAALATISDPRQRGDFAGQTAAIFATRGQPALAIEFYRRALQLASPAPAIANDFAWLLATLPPRRGGDGPHAVRLATEAQQSAGGDSPAILDTLATALAADGQFDSAIETAQHAHRQALAQGDGELARQIHHREQLYRVGRPYRTP